MAKVLWVKGSSDDLITLEVVGGRREEFPHSDSLLSFQDGTVLSVAYDGEWSFRVLNKGWQLDQVIPIDRATDDYSERVRFHDVPDWVVHGSAIVYASDMTGERS